MQHTGFCVNGISVKTANAAPWVLHLRRETADFCRPQTRYTDQLLA
jgi:hypothetical protein